MSHFKVSHVLRSTFHVLRACAPHSPALCVILLTAWRADAAGGDDVPAITVTIPSTAERVHLFGATLGSNWAGFPSIAQRDYNSTTEQLDVTLPIYIDWEQHINVGPACPPTSAVPNPTQVSPPRALSTEAWFAGHHLEMSVGYFPASDGPDYTTCLEGVGIEEPVSGSYPVNADCTLRVRDIHGGVADGSHILALQYLSFSSGVNPVDAYLLILRWNRPQSYTDVASGAAVDATPGTTSVRRPLLITVNRIVGPGAPQVCGPYPLWYTMYVVEHVSADISQASRRFVDAGDLGAMAPFIGQSVKWGFTNDGGPSARNFHCNLVPFGTSALAIDSADLGKFAAELGSDCQAQKVGDEERAAVFAWFGMSATGQDIVTGPNGETSPEFVFTDQAQLDRAVADPYGYRRLVRAARSVPWGRVKSIYR